MNSSRLFVRLILPVSMLVTISGHAQSAKSISQNPAVGYQPIESLSNIYKPRIPSLAPARAGQREHSWGASVETGLHGRLFV